MINLKNQILGSLDKYQGIVQIIKFGIVGLSNTLVSYIVYLIILFLGVHYIVGNIMGFILSVLNSFYWNNKYVFKEEQSNRVWWKALIKTYLSYGFTGIIISNIVLIVTVKLLNISTVIAPLFGLVITIPLNFLINKFWAFR